MGGRVGVHVLPGTSRAVAVGDCRLVLGRLGAWASRLTRFASTSDLARLNADPRSSVPVRPTLAAVLDWGRGAEAATDSIVNIAMLDERLAAEEAPGAQAGRPRRHPPPSQPMCALPMHGRWTVAPAGPASGGPWTFGSTSTGWPKAGSPTARSPSWIGMPAAVVDADGDVAVRLDPGQSWWIGVGDPRDADVDLATLRFEGETRFGSTRFGIATSGTSVHRWSQRQIGRRTTSSTPGPAGPPTPTSSRRRSSHGRRARPRRTRRRP